MSLPWSARQLEWLAEMGFDVLARRETSPPDAAGIGGDAGPQPRLPLEAGHHVKSAIPPGLVKAARGVDLAPLLAVSGIPRDAASRRALWRALRPLRRAARAG